MTMHPLLVILLWFVAYSGAKMCRYYGKFDNIGFIWLMLLILLLEILVLTGLGVVMLVLKS